MSVLLTLQRSTSDPLAALAATLAALAASPRADVYCLLFGSDTS
jgi:hypothetical protein